ncbi:hypothetical protein Ddye_017427 [Dipteronia dyeriana]|uniref:Caffeic acid O-methyltransferase n=1 Tax=Dipteronia dyeriana TaxID=168575 RepID=A0AAD9X0Y3_9ROSI|nr:hypothetical protein Ddye_017427 [Dipteronia dyeriana]
MAPSAETQLKPNVEKQEEEEEYYSYASQLAMSVVLPMAMKTAIELQVFDIIAKAGPCAKLSALEITTQIPTRNPNAPTMLDRILRLLFSYRVLDCSVSDGKRMYGLSPVSKYFVSNDKDDGVSLSPYLVLPLQTEFLECWPLLKDAIIEGGIPFNKVHGMHFFENLAVNKKLNDVYNKAMFNHTTIVMKRTLETYKGFEPLKQLVDVGGGLGMTLALITSKYPHIKAINFDLPHVIKDAPSYPGVEHVSGDMFQSVPKGDAIFMKWILNCCGDEHCLKLLKNCYKAIPDDGKVIVMNVVMPVVPEMNDGARDSTLVHVNLLIKDDGGTERTKEEFMALATLSGFKGINFVGCVCNYYIMEFFK